jgi:hypothetical protein
LIRRFLAARSVGGPQFLAAALLFVYLLQCGWLIHVQTRHGLLPDPSHALRIYQGLEQWKSGAVAGTPASQRAEAATGLPSTGLASHLRLRDGYDLDRAPLYYLTAAAPVLVAPAALPDDSTLGQLWFATPYLFFGVMLGGSLWYVARRLYGNAGGYVALALYCFSPAMIVNAGGAPSLSEMGAVWGVFGAIWTAIAVAHTLYAPREVVLWNWRRILLLGLSFVLVMGNQFSLSIAAIVALLLMFWVAPIRKGAALVIWSTAALFAIILLYLSYLGEPLLFLRGLRHAQWIEAQPQALLMAASYRHWTRALYGGSPPLMLALPVALAAYALWKRARYFGNTVPLVVAVLLTLLSLLAPTFPGEGFSLATLVFVFAFVAGVFADLFETRHGLLAKASVAGLLAASALWNLLQLARLS